MSIENLDIKFAIEFLKNIGYIWDGCICGKDKKPTTIYTFFYPQEVKLINRKNEEEIKGLSLYDECTEKPYFAISNKHSVSCFVEEINLTKEWTLFLKEIGLTC